MACHCSALPLLSEAPPSVEPGNRARGAGTRRVGKTRLLLSAPADTCHLERSYLVRLRREVGTYALATTTYRGRRSGGLLQRPLCCGAISTAGSGGWPEPCVAPALPSREGLVSLTRPGQKLRQNAQGTCPSGHLSILSGLNTWENVFTEKQGHPLS